MNKRIVKDIFLPVILLLALSGCATIGKPFHFKGPGEIKIGKTTQKEIMARYGDPYRVGYDGGSVQWTYCLYKYRVFGESETKDLIVTFKRNGRVSNYVYNSSLEEDKIKILVHQQQE